MLPEPHFLCLVLCIPMTLDVMQKEYAQAKPARDALAEAKKEAEASVSNEGPLHDENEWNIR